MSLTPGTSDPSEQVVQRKERRLAAWLRNAFAVEAAAAFSPTDEERELVERLAGGIVRRGLVAPALLLLESSRPLNFLGSQLLLFLGPVADLVVRGQGHRTLQQILERRGSTEYICSRIEALAAGPSAER